MPEKILERQLRVAVANSHDPCLSGTTPTATNTTLQLQATPIWADIMDEETPDMPPLCEYLLEVEPGCEDAEISDLLDMNGMEDKEEGSMYPIQQSRPRSASNAAPPADSSLSCSKVIPVYLKRGRKAQRERWWQRWDPGEVVSIYVQLLQKGQVLHDTQVVVVGGEWVQCVQVRHPRENLWSDDSDVVLFKDKSHGTSPSSTSLQLPEINSLMLTLLLCLHLEKLILTLFFPSHKAEQKKNKDMNTTQVEQDDTSDLESQ
ncbi:hypothetical protein FQN60_001934 [Etheostoma spectabile]|uniref:Uncharacterized protein n=1 Tax=Etheostoma spectabile TaxID=54343 RepID=A0A5J5DDS6_9PERO|nr:hypothetical protein FQN60_001934 [Etheostoma spectabile]